MPRQESEPLEKVTIRLFDGDKDELNSLYPDLGYNKVIRHMVRNLIRKVKEETNKNYTPNKTNIDIKELINDD